MHVIIEKNKWVQALFVAVREATLESGGDGEGYIVGPEWEVLAAAFDKFEHDIGFPNFIERSETNDRVFFSSGQEFVCFGPDRSVVMDAADIVAEVLIPLII
jgi:hypothetical protein